jgi:hypothetical protein
MTAETMVLMLTKANIIVIPVRTIGWTNLTKSLWKKKGMVATYFRDEYIVRNNNQQLVIVLSFLSFAPTLVDRVSNKAVGKQVQ